MKALSKTHKPEAIGPEAGNSTKKITLIRDAHSIPSLRGLRWVLCLAMKLFGLKPCFLALLLSKDEPALQGKPGSGLRV